MGKIAGSLRLFFSRGRRGLLPLAVAALIAGTGIETFPGRGCAEDAGSFPFVGEISTQKYLNIRAGQNTNFEKVGQLLNGDKVVVVAKDYDWYKIKLPENADSYISAKYVKMLSEGIAEVLGDRVNIRAQPRIEAAILGQIEKETLVRVLDQPDLQWAKIEPIDESYGWVAAEYVRRTDLPVPPARVVQLPIKNIYVKKRMAEEAARKEAQTAEEAQPPKDPNSISVQGIIIDVNQETLSADIRHSIVLENNQAYYLKGYRRLFDIFLHNKVSVEGVALPEMNTSHPVIFVNRISYVL
ncbi:MAG TPA: SH3 domain-containing protein [Candidatus Omnitrophota bacterium]|nr:SH3 domain-containing protein [Candidatus Omnitrophota bacterium]HQO57527.1 SH3 domain-containing protein [Candidatus Omnitrophota bacterium]HQP11234.1 SH3 domain-containing protein [Candidatus Omnitrophota bacterium]